MITIEQWESVSLKVPDDDYIAVELFSDLQIYTNGPHHLHCAKLLRRNNF